MTRSIRLWRVLALVGLVGTLAVLPGRPALAAEQVIYADGLAPSWQNYSWANVNLAATSPVHGGSNSIAVTYGAWEGLYLGYPALSTQGYTRLRFWIHGGSAGSQQVNVYAQRATDPPDSHGPEIGIPAPAAGAWSEVTIALADLGAANTTLTGLVWQDAIGASQPTLYIDDIALIDDASPDGPVLSGGMPRPSSAPADGLTTLVVRAAVADPQGVGDITSVTLDAAPLGRGSVAMRDDGRSNDGAAGDGVYGAALTVAPGTAPGEALLFATAQDAAGHRASLTLGAFAILAPAGGQIPAALPQQIAWGTNEWDEIDAQDWQLQSGVPWQYVYQYITYGWEGWGDTFVGRFVDQAWRKGYVPVISAYLMLDTPPACGEGGQCYAQKLQNPSTVSTYLASISEAARQAQGDKPVIFHLDPDFYGTMQQLSNQNDRPAGVRPDDPSSYPVALNVAGYPNTLAGFGQRVVDVIHSQAPNALVAPHASMWATNGDPNLVTPEQTVQIAQRTAAFLNAMGGDRADLLFVEWSDRDSGSGLRPWWDDSNHDLPRPTRAVLWESALSQAAGKRLILWQMPSGNMSLDNTPTHYQDNRPAYAFSHPRDLFDAGVIAVLFGGGTAEMTQPSTDGGFIATQGAIAYAAPAAVSGLQSDGAAGPVAQLHWQENGEPDLWGYQLQYQPAGGGPLATFDARRANVAALLLPDAGSWDVSVAAYDAQGRLGPPSEPVRVTTTEAPRRVFLPLVRR
jgi:hypothetical protein